MKLCREADLEQHVFHHVATVWPGQAEFAPALGLEHQIIVGMTEQHVVEAPLPGTQDTGNAHLATHRDVRQAHTPTGRIARRPGFTRTRIRRMPIGAQGLTVGEGMGQRGQELLAIGAHQFGGDRCRGDLDQDDVVKAYTIERVFQREHTLDFVGHDHRFEHGTNGQWSLAVGQAFLRQVVGHRKNATEVI
ncbi:hypothetical protein D3C73_947270 [compost metagenome]